MHEQVHFSAGLLSLLDRGEKQSLIITLPSLLSFFFPFSHRELCFGSPQRPNILAAIVSKSPRVRLVFRRAEQTLHDLTKWRQRKYKGRTRTRRHKPSERERRTCNTRNEQLNFDWDRVPSHSLSIQLSRGTNGRRENRPL